MILSSLTSIAKNAPTQRANQIANQTVDQVVDSPPKAQENPSDKLEVRFDDHRPAHRNVKKITRAVAGLVGATGLASTAYLVATSSGVADAASKAVLGLAGTAAAVVGVDLVSGLGHHWGDNYGLPNSKPLDHTKWHTDTHDSGYCLVGLSNKALDAVDFWPRWERTVEKFTGKTPVAWQVESYKDYVAGELSKEQLAQQLEQAGMK